MNQERVKQVVKQCFKEFYLSDYLTYAIGSNMGTVIHRYAADLWHNRNPDEIERDQKCGVSASFYLRWCKQQWAEILQSTDYENQRAASCVHHIGLMVKILAAMDFKNNPEVYNGPGTKDSVEQFSQHLWLQRSPEQVQRDKELGVIQDDYFTWCCDEFRKYRKGNLNTVS